MKIILLQDIQNLGKKGDIKEVSNGYARNFLLPQKIAEIARESTIKRVEAQKEREKSFEKAKKEELKSLAEKIKGKKITLKVKEKDGKLFGSVTAKDIQQELKKENLSILLSSVTIKEPIKKIGEYKIEIKLSEEIKEKIILKVEGAE